MGLFNCFDPSSHSSMSCIFGSREIRDAKAFAPDHRPRTLHKEKVHERNDA